MVLIKYDKVKVILTNSLYSILNQLDFYKKYNYLKNPFISKIFYAFQDKSSFYLVKKFYPGGDLRYHINRKYISESKSKFLIANIILGLEFLHSKGYIYRNLIPENLIFDKKGYLHLNDMTLLREISNINYLVTSGHPGYMAPEIILRQKHGTESDFFSLGVILYEIMFNKLPYKSKSKEEYLNDLVSSHNALIKEDELNIGWSRECADFINRCIQKRAELRIGFGGIEELKTHKWLKDFDWEKLKKKELSAPSIPRGTNNYTIRNNDEYNIEFIEENIYDFIEYYETMNYFNGYYYNYNLDINFNKEKDNINEEEDEIKNEINDENKNNELIENIEGIEEEENNKDVEQDENINNIENNADKIKIKKKKKKSLIEEEYENENDDNIEYNNNKKNKKNKKKNDEDDDDIEEINLKENKKRKKRKESIDSKFLEDESKGQLMNTNNKKGLFVNKTFNKRKSVRVGKLSKKNLPRESVESLNLNFKKKNKNN